MYTIRKTADLAGVTVKTLRHYEKVGLLLPSSRTVAGYRLYSDEDLAKLKLIRFYRELHFVIKDIPTMLYGSPQDQKEVVEKQLRLIQESTSRYEKIEDQLLQSFDYKEHPKVNTAILVIDMQNDFINGPLGCIKVRSVIKPIQELLTEAKIKNIPIFYICDCHIRGIHQELRIWGDHAIAGTEGAEIIDELTPYKTDQIVYKPFYNGFYKTELNLLLRQLDVGRLIVTGLHANMCVAETIIEAHHFGYHIVVPKECVSALTEGEYQYSLKLMKKSYDIDILHLDRVLETL